MTAWIPMLVRRTKIIDGSSPSGAHVSLAMNRFRCAITANILWHRRRPEMSNQPYRLRPLGTSDLELVRTWRNRPEIRSNMFTRHEISREEHETYFDKALGDPSKRFFLCVDASGTPVGMVNIVNIDVVHRTASWGFYSGDMSRRGIGTWMEFLALDYVFQELGMEKLQCEVLEWNRPIVEFHLKFGFSIEGIARRQHVRENARYDVFQLAIHRTEWVDFVRPEFEARLLCALSGDSNEIHTSDEAARAAGFEERVVPGMLIAAVVSRVLGTEFPGRGTVYLRQDIAFEKPVYPNRAVLAEFRVLRRVGRRVTIETMIGDPQDRSVLARGEANVLIPKGPANA